MRTALQRPCSFGQAPCARRPAAAMCRRANAAQRRPRLAALPKPTSDVIAGADEDHMRELQELFQAADLNGNGRIDRDELKHLLQSVDSGRAVLFIQEGWLADADVDAAMAKYDLDSSGDICFDEFQNIVRDGMLLSGTLRDYEDAFNAVDTSGNGTIGATELSHLFQSLGTPMSVEKVAEVFMKYDKDQSGQIEFFEWLHMFRDQLLDLGAIRRFLDSNPDALANEENKGILETVSGQVSVIFTEEELSAALTQHPERLTVLFCGLTWCRPCMGMTKPYARLAAAYGGSTTFLKLFGNANPSCKRMFREFKIRSTPSFVLYKGSKVVGTVAGANKARLEAFIRQQLPPDQVPGKILYPLPAAVEPPAMQVATMPA